MDSQKPSRKATIIGFGAIFLWASLAVLISLSAKMPPFQMVAISFYIAFFIGLFAAFYQGENLFKTAKMPLKIWALGIGGLFGYHFLLFIAMQNAPVLQASLINYLWPLLIVLFSRLLPKSKGGGRLKYFHIIGALFGLFGMILILNPKDIFSFSNVNWLGYMAAFAAAIVWASYSVLSRLISHIPTHAVTLFCLATAISATIFHLYFEQTIWPQNAGEWLATIALGLGPVGGAFYLWDYGMKHGDISVLGAGAYLTPLLSSFMLVILGISEANLSLWVAAILITIGALIAAKDMIFMVNKK